MSDLHNQAVSGTILSAFDEDVLVAKLTEMRREMDGICDLAMVFISSDWIDYHTEVMELVQIYGRAKRVVISSTAGFIGTGEENENISGCSLCLLALPNATVEWAGLTQDQVEEANGGDYWRRVSGIRAENPRGFLVLTNPLAFDSEEWLKSWNAAFPGASVFGAILSGMREMDFLLTTNEATDLGAVVISFSGGVRLDGFVSQGCRPIGEPYTVTAADENVLFKIGMRDAYHVLLETVESLDEEDQEQAQGNIFAGLAVSEYRDEFQSGDFLVRNILGGDPKEGALAIGAIPRIGQTMQFQLRDQESATIELEGLCEKHKPSNPLAAFLFTCAGRGSRMFHTPNHDAGILADVVGSIPTTGCFAAGEIGPIGGTNFIHGYTASVAFLVNE